MYNYAIPYASYWDYFDHHQIKMSTVDECNMILMVTSRG